MAINNLLPERIDTGRQRFMAERMMKTEKITYEEARARIVDSIAARRFGKPSEFGDAAVCLSRGSTSWVSFWIGQREACGSVSTNLTLQLSPQARRYPTC